MSGGSTDTTAQTALTSHNGREIVAHDTDDDRRIRCPDCRQDVTASKGTHPAPDDAPAAKLWGWVCDTCENTFPANVTAADAPMYNDRITGVEVTFRDGRERLVPVPSTRIEEVDA